MKSSATYKDLVLVGGGHANIQVLKKLAMRPIEHLRLTLVSDVLYAPYSGMLPGHLAGFYSFEEVHFDLPRLCSKAGVRFVHGTVCDVDTMRQQVILDDRRIAYDLLAINVGCTPSLPANISQSALLPMKPISKFIDRWQNLMRSVMTAETPPRVAVVGGGAAGVEVALILQEKARSRQMQIRLFQSEQRLLPTAPPALAAQLQLRAQKAGLDVRVGQRVTNFVDGELQGETQSLGRYDYVIWATDASAAFWLAEAFATDAKGFVRVRHTLQAEEHDNIFAAGDCAAFPEPLPKAGVYAVRQGPVLEQNIRNLLRQRPLRAYKPQRKFLSLVTAGEKIAYATRGRYLGSGKLWWHIKDYIDRKFMRVWQDFSKMPVAPRYDFSLPAPPAYEPNTCGGCGSKVSPMTLQAIIRKYASDEPFGLGRDDAVVMPPTDLYTVESVDMFRAFVSDPFLFGRISVLHALSDLYAMRAIPLSAQAIVQIPEAPGKIVARDLDLLMQGITTQLRHEGVPLTGGHTVVGTDLQAGFAVMGRTNTPVAKTGLKAGDVLLLTKPLGTGACLAALMKGELAARHLAEVVEGMGRSSRVGLTVPHVHAMTDVTGFGLAGHLREMLADTELMAEVDGERLPVYAGFDAAIAAGHRGRLSLTMESEAPGLPPVFYDPQTSGGLLLACRPEHQSEVLDHLRQAGFPAATTVGFVRQRRGAEPRIVLAQNS